jgi:hypothetical protein
MSKSTRTPEHETAAEDSIAAALSPRDYLRFRLNANLRNRRILPAVEGWRINRDTQPEREEMIRLGRDK